MENERKASHWVMFAKIWWTIMVPGPVKSSDVANNAVECSEVVQSESLAVATPKEVAQEAARKQLPKCQGTYVDGFIQGVDATLTVDTRACDTIVSHCLRKLVMIIDHNCLKSSPEGVLVVNH